MEFRKKKTPILFIVADIGSTAVLGQSACEKLQLVKRLFGISVDRIEVGSDKKNGFVLEN